MFFEPKKILEKQYLMNFIVGMRGTGKTFSTLKFFVDEFLNKGHQFVYCRRLKEEIKVCKHSLMSNLQANGFFIENDIKIKGDVIYIDKKIAGFFIYISGAYSLKSTAFPHVKYLLFDEFISENKRYLRDEVDMFLSVVETVGRMREIQLVLLANQSSKFNPYYLYWNIQPNANNITKYKQKSIIIYDFDGKEYVKAKKKTKFGKLIEGTKYAKLLVNNENIQDDYSLIDKLNSCKKFPLINLVIEGKNIVVYDVIQENSYLLYFAIRGNISSVKTLNYDEKFIENASIESLRETPINKKITRYMRKGNIRFKDIPTKQIIENFIF